MVWQRPRLSMVRYLILSGVAIVAAGLAACSSASRAEQSPASTATSARAGTLEGIGATEADWNREHSARASSGTGQFVAVSVSDGRVTGFTILSERPGISQTAALAAAKAQVPNNVIQTGRATLKDADGNPGCVQINYTSAALAKALRGTTIHDANGGVHIVLSSFGEPVPSKDSVPPYNEEHVDTISLGPGTSIPSEC